MTKQYRLRETFNYNNTGPTYCVVEEKKLFDWKNVYGDACSYMYGGRDSFPYDEAKQRLENCIEQAAIDEEASKRYKAFKPRILTPPLPDKEPE
jgi:hypothetical protein